MKIALITLATVKDQLGLTDTAYDSRIEALIPIVSSDVRRILNTKYDTYLMASYTSGSDVLNTYYPGIGYKKLYSRESVALDMGQVITGEYIPDDIYIIAQDPDTGDYTMSQPATGSGSYVYPTITIAMWPTISKMIWYKVTANAQKIDPKVKSKSVAGLSVSFADSEIDNRYSYPVSLIEDLGIPFAEVE